MRKNFIPAPGGFMSQLRYSPVKRGRWELNDPGGSELF
jgi:hypothetical protein